MVANNKMKFPKLIFYTFICLMSISPINSCANEKNLKGELTPVVKDNQKIVWQQSSSLNIQLGIRDKFGMQGSYEALFVVTDSKGKKSKLTKKVSSDKWQFVSFPEDFDTFAKAGIYSWQGIVNGKTVIDGKFEFTKENSVRIIEK